MDNQENNLRREDRIPAEINISADKHDPVYFALLRDFSPSGFQVMFFRKYPTGTRLNFALNGPQTVFRCQGEVRWVKRRGLFRPKYLAGIEIVGNRLPEAFQREIREFLNL